MNCELINPNYTHQKHRLIFGLIVLLIFYFLTESLIAFAHVVVILLVYDLFYLDKTLDQIIVNISTGKDHFLVKSTNRSVILSKKDIKDCEMTKELDKDFKHIYIFTIHLNVKSFFGDKIIYKIMSKDDIIISSDYPDIIQFFLDR